MTKYSVSLHQPEVTKSYEYPRKDIIEKALKELDDVTLTELPKEEVDYVVYFDGDLIIKNPNVMNMNISELLEFEQGERSRAIFDVAHPEVFWSNPTLAFTLSLCCTCASIVTCTTPEAQEVIYEHTGRLACIVENPISEDSYKAPDMDEFKRQMEPKILWFGLLSEIFSIRKQQKTDYPEMEIETVAIDSVSPKILENKVADADFLYFPKTALEHSEAIRLQKVEYGILEGKFVVAPDLEEDVYNLAFDGELNKALAYFRSRNITEWITEKQELLKTIYSFDKTKKTLQKVFEVLPEEEALELPDALSDLLEMSEILKKEQ